MAKQVRESLNCKLQGTFASHQDRSFGRAFFFSGYKGTYSKPRCVTDTAEDCLVEHFDQWCDYPVGSEQSSSYFTI
jgi:hypothetical protein